MTDHTTPNHDQTPTPGEGTAVNSNEQPTMDLDARITAYALGELDADEARDIEMYLARDPEAQATVESLRALGDDLTTGLATLPAPQLTDDQRTAIMWGAEPAAAGISFTLRRWAMIGGGVAVAASITLAVLLPLLPSGGDGNDDFAMLDATTDEASPMVAEAVPVEDLMLGQPLMPPDAGVSGGVYVAQPNGAAAGAPPAPGSEAWSYHLHSRVTPHPPAERGRMRLGTMLEMRVQPQDEFFGFEADGDFVGGGGGAAREGYDFIVENPFRVPDPNDFSTFSIDVDTASYANMRRFLNQNMLPPAGAVRIEEMLNYFSYDYVAPSPGDPHPFAVHVDSTAASWNPEHRLVRIGLQGKAIEMGERPAANLVFLLDVSGSMNDAMKLPLVKSAMRMLTDELDDDDSVSVVVYAGAAGLVLPPTSGSKKADIIRAIENLSAGGSTAGGAGIQLAYDVAVQNFIDGGINRVILATDGDFNVGMSSDDELTRLIEEKRASGVFLSVLGVGTGNYQDAKMEQLSNTGNGTYAYLDSEREAQRVLVEQVNGTLVTIAKDVKIQVDFNPEHVQAYRLIGYENRVMASEDFKDDTKDAGEIGSGHSVTALYEIVPPGVEIDLPEVEESKYRKNRRPRAASANNEDSGASDFEAEPTSKEMLTVRLRYKQPDGDEATELHVPFIDAGTALVDAGPDLAFAAAVAEFGMLLRNSTYLEDRNPQRILELAEAGLGPDARGDRREFLELVKKMANLTDQ